MPSSTPVTRPPQRGHGYGRSTGLVALLLCPGSHLDGSFVPPAVRELDAGDPSRGSKGGPPRHTMPERPPLGGQAPTPRRKPLQSGSCSFRGARGMHHRSEQPYFSHRKRTDARHLCPQCAFLLSDAVGSLVARLGRAAADARLLVVAVPPAVRVLHHDDPLATVQVAQAGAGRGTHGVLAGVEPKRRSGWVMGCPPRSSVGTAA